MDDYEDYEEDLKEPSKELIKNGNYFTHNVLNKELKSIRYPICKECDSFDSILKLCKECHCFMPMKTLLPPAECPLKKW